MSREIFTLAYIECAFWSSHANEAGDSFEHLNYSADDLSVSARTAIDDDCKDFYAAYASTWANVPRYSDEQAGHDYWLTRNGHGAGFWDRGLPEPLGKLLTDAAHQNGSADLYLNDQTDEIEIS